MGEDGERGIQVLKMALQAEDIGANYDSKASSDFLVEMSNKKNKAVDNINKREFKQGV